MQQHGFGVVPGVVGGENPVLLPRGQAVKKPVADLPAAFLQPQALPPGKSRHILPQQGKAQAPALGKGLGGSFVPLGFLPPQLVVHMGQHQPPGVHPVQQPVAQGGGVRPAGKAHHHQAPVRQAGQIRGGQTLTHCE